MFNCIKRTDPRNRFVGRPNAGFFRFDKLSFSMGPTPNLDNCAFFEQAVVTGVSITL